ncbi:MAG: carbamoyltransferase HypF, partial [Ignavibacteria bacterium]|nr:carbamoyltransferase HypF [Ignavibacteria bacterium]
ALGVSWDGTGYGDDGNIWGGEFFISTDNEVKHIAQFRNFRLPGGEIAIKESRRSALGVLFEIFGKDKLPYDVLSQMFTDGELKILIQLLEKEINSPRTSSVGRLFDAVSSILGLSYRSNFEGQSAMKLEFIINPEINDYYQFELSKNELIVIDWKNIIECILVDLKNGVPASSISTKFHNTLVQIIISIAKEINLSKVILTGGCFQNVYLLEKSVNELSKNKFKTYWHQRVPPNDGGISLGQIAFAHYNLQKNKFNNYVFSELNKKV